jgi:hypothetical protein
MTQAKIRYDVPLAADGSSPDILSLGSTRSSSSSSSSSNLQSPHGGGGGGAAAAAVLQLCPASEQVRSGWLLDLAGGCPVNDLAQQVPDNIDRSALLDMNR